MKQTADCSLCGKAANEWFEKFGRKVHFCSSCHHIMVPAGVALSSDGVSIYESEHSVFETDGNEEYYLDETNMLAAQAKAAFVRKYCPSRSSLLDAGSSYGHFLTAIRESHDAYGVEINRGVVDWSIQHFGVRSFAGSIYALPKELPTPFDVITSWDVIEHLEDPRRALVMCKEHLKKGGWLFLSTPDAGSLVARVMGRYWHYLDPVQHINLFSRKNLIRLLEETGFTVRSYRYFGHQYKVSYVLNRISYLTKDSIILPFVRMIDFMARPLKHTRVSVKLWDVVGIAAQL